MRRVLGPRVLLNPARPITDDTFMEAPMPDARPDPLKDGACFRPARIAIFAVIGACGWAAFVLWVL